MQVKATLLREGARLPQRGHGIDVGLDVFTPKAGILNPGVNKIPLGFSIEVPVGYGAFIYPRTGMASGEKTLDMELQIIARLGLAHEKVLLKEMEPKGVSIIAHMPPIDPGYTGEVHAIVTNASEYYIKYPQHTRFGQLVFYPIVYAVLVHQGVDMSRGDQAFGSTGTGGILGGSGS